MSTWVNTSNNNLQWELKLQGNLCLEKHFISDGHLLMLGIHGKQKLLLTRTAQQTGSLSSPIMVFRPFIELMKKTSSLEKKKE